MHRSASRPDNAKGDDACPCPAPHMYSQDPSTVDLPENLVDLEYMNEPAMLQALHGIWDKGSAQVHLTLQHGCLDLSLNGL